MLEIKIATEGNFQEINSIVEKHQSMPNNYFNGYTFDNHESIVEKNNEIFFVATDEHNTVGFLRLHCSDCSSEFKTNCHAVESEAVIDPDYRIKGIGSALLTEAINFTTTQTMAMSFVTKIKNGNIVAEKLCKKFGFLKQYTSGEGAYWHLEIKR